MRCPHTLKEEQHPRLEGQGVDGWAPLATGLGSLLPAQVADAPQCQHSGQCSLLCFTRPARCSKDDTSMEHKHGKRACNTGGTVVLADDHDAPDAF